MADETLEFLDYDGLAEYHSKVNDMTTGVNLLRGTRDCLLGSKIFNGYNMRYLDGFALNRNSSVHTDEKSGFSYCLVGQDASGTSSLISSVVPDIKQDSTFTVYLEVQPSGISADDNLLTVLFGGMTGNNTIQQSRATAKELMGSRFASTSDEWIPCKYVATYTSDKEAYMIVAADITSSMVEKSIKVRKMAVYSGSINNPIWSESPFDTSDGYGTGVNLLRKTRTFEKGSTSKIGNQLFFDNGWFGGSTTLANIIYGTDENGFTTIGFNPSSSVTLEYYSSTIHGMKLGDKYTFFFDFMIEDKSAFSQDQYIAYILFRKKDGYSGWQQAVGVRPDRVSNLDYSSIKSGEWNHIAVPFEITSSPEETDVMLVNLRTTKPGAIKFRLPGIYKDHIKNPLYSESPLDTVTQSQLESINDYTTGINLLRGTRDFIEGKMVVYTNVNTRDTFIDGFADTTRTGVSILKDESGFSYVQLDNRTVQSGELAIKTSAVFGLKPSEWLTISGEIMVDDVSIATENSPIFVTIRNTETSVNKLNTYVTYEQLGINKASRESGKWYPFVYHIQVPATVTSTDYFRFGLLTRDKGVINFRLLDVQEGKINHPIWSQNPLDSASSQVETSEPVYLGSLDSKKAIKTNEDLNNLTNAGTYLCSSNQKAATLTNSPTSYAFKLFVEWTTGTDYYIRQRAVSFNEASTEWIRFYDGDKKSWSEWRRTVNNRSIITSDFLDVNDDTTGINLLRGTKDFFLGTDKIGAFFKDGFTNTHNYSFYKDDEGFTVATVTNPTTGDQYILQSSVITNYRDYPKLTISYEVKFDETFNNKTNTALRIRYLKADGSIGVDQTIFSLPTLGLNNAVGGKWYKVVLAADINTSENEDIGMINITLVTPPQSTAHFRKLCVYSGAINHPIWSASPFDIDRINDETTGINLLKGTKDFHRGTTRDTAYTSFFYDDGFNASSNAILRVDDEGFTTIRYESGNTSIHSSYVTNIKKGDVYTGFYEIKFDEETKRINDLGTIRVLVKDSQKITSAFSSSLPETLEAGVWYLAKAYITVAEDYGENAELAISMGAPIGSEVRKLGIYKGLIANPIWNDSPADLNRINDETTGINLLRGTRDIVVSDNAYESSVYSSDGFKIGQSYAPYITISKEDGYGIINIERSGLSTFGYTSIRSSVCPLNENDRNKIYTVSFDVMVDDLDALDSNVIGSVELYNFNTKLRIVINDISLSSAVVTPVSKEWARIIYHYTVPSTVVDNSGLILYLQLAKNGSIHFRKPLLYSGKINHPIWSPSPFDIDYINDETTGINLALGTRDFVQGLTNSPKNSSYKLDGWTNISSNINYETDLDGFTCLTTGRESTTLHVFTSVCEDNFKPGDIITFAFEVRLNKPIADNLDLGILYTWNGASHTGYDSIKSSSSMPVGEWIRLKVQRVVPQNYDPETGFVLGRLSFQENTNVSYKRAMIYKGRINNPVWSPSPFDVLSDAMLIESLQIDDDLFKLYEKVEHAQTKMFYAYNGSIIETIKNKPTEAKVPFFVICMNHAPGVQADLIYIEYASSSAIKPRIYRASIGSINASKTWETVAFLSDITSMAPSMLGVIPSENEIAANSDLNLFTKAGTYNCSKRASVATLKNDPDGLDGAFKLYVEYTNGVNSSLSGSYSYIRQRIVVLGANATEWIRYQADVNGEWTPWRETVNNVSVTERPLISGLYKGRSITNKFTNEIGTNHVANWLSSRVTQGNFEGLNIGDYVDISCDGINMRYRIAAIDPYFWLGNPVMNHHIAMVPDETWGLSAAKDGDYLVGNSYIYWNKEATNNGTSGESHPYLASNLHKWEIEKMLPRFPKEWQDVMLDYYVLLETRYSASSKLTDSTGWSWANLGKIWSLSETEVFGQVVWGTKGYSMGMDGQFPLFRDPKARLTRGNSYRINAWLRTAMGGSSASVVTIGGSGQAQDASAVNSTTRPLPCFMIG